MAKNKDEKQKIIEDLEEKIKIQKAMVFVDFSGIDSKFLFALREKLKKANCLLKVVKKTLLEKTLGKLEKKEISEKIKTFKGQLALVFGFEDEVMPAKICYQVAKENENLKILAGVFGGEFKKKEKVIELAQLPSRGELLARLVGGLENPISNFVNVLKGNIKGLIYILARAKT
ncbi:MAG: 50S ribosomal protein L10 [Patescibacteria group bacterium]|nr:50S ribosomal protein L10 [Patescibacteria group bacterium]